MKHFTLPAELLKFSVFNMVDLDAGSSSTGSRNAALTEDKELLMSIEELEKKFSISSELVENSLTSSPAVKLVNPHPHPPVPSSNKFIRPDVTWLRRTEYISSVKNNPNGTLTNPNLSVDEAKVILNEPIKFDEIKREVDETFSKAKDGKHPSKKNLELVQSFPINYSNVSDYVKCLILGDNLATENSILTTNYANVISLFNPDSQSTTFKSSGEFDIQKSESGKSFVVMLPTNHTTESAAIMAKINANFSLRKRRAATKGKEKLKKVKVIKVNRT